MELRSCFARSSFVSWMTASLRYCPELKRMIPLRPGNRLSVPPVTPEEWKALLALALRPR